MTEYRVALVTGGAYGIGRGIAQEFAKKGDAIVIADRDDKRGAELESSLRKSGAQALFVHTDIRIESDVGDTVHWDDQFKIAQLNRPAGEFLRECFTFVPGSCDWAG